ncbi:chalcone isomerase family protein [Desulfuromonas sp. AOP6]|uniref:chalcone isomerase family protein n=1 Tax=Desulfuromonas sp. AOP6 TaxID=1566351 RepID=UPI001281CE08|nr:chalcone isomerase family protein [Desulfuromonas sp. AOP6]BCA79300.1 hypothetical protein AOP6_1087 [Desulfuromonas sp. AOP6]
MANRHYGRNVLAAALAMILFTSAGHAAEIHGVQFPDQVHVNGRVLTIKGTAILKWAGLFSVYVGAFYLPAEVPADRWRDDVAKKLELSYFREIEGEDFGKASDKLLRENHSEKDYQILESRLNLLYRLFQDVRAGDRYGLAYSPGGGTELRLNGQILGTIPGADFAVAYFGIWLGDNPISEDFRDNLLGR